MSDPHVGRRAFALGLGMLACHGLVRAQAADWPTRPLRLVTPAPIVARLRAAMQHAVQQPSVRGPLEAEGAVMFDVDPATFDAFVREETTRWGDIIRAANIQLG